MCKDACRCVILLAFDLEPHTSTTLFGRGAWRRFALLASGFGFRPGRRTRIGRPTGVSERGLKALSSLYALALDSLDKAQHLSGLLETFPVHRYRPKRSTGSNRSGTRSPRPSAVSSRTPRGDGQTDRGQTQAETAGEAG